MHIFSKTNMGLCYISTHGLDILARTIQSDYVSFPHP